VLAAMLLPFVLCLDATVCCVSPFLAHVVKCIEVMYDLDSMLCCERLYLCCIFHIDKLLPLDLCRTVSISILVHPQFLCIIFGFLVVCVAFFNDFLCPVQCRALISVILHFVSSISVNRFETAAIGFTL